MTRAKKWVTSTGLTSSDLDLLNEYAAPEAMCAMAASLALSTLMLLLAITRLVKHRTAFHAGVVLGCLAFSINDVWFFVVMAVQELPNSFELVRTLSPALAAAQIAGLSISRFRVFAATAHARWYSPRVRHTLLAVNYAAAAAALAVLAWSFVGIDMHAPIATDPARKVAILAVAGLSVVIDGVLTVISLRIVLRIRAELDASLAEGVGKVESSGRWRRRRARRGLVRKILVALSAMLVFSVGGMAVYGVSKTVVGHMVADIFPRLYCLAAMVEWYLVVDLVKDKPSGSSSSSHYATTTSHHGAHAMPTTADPSGSYSRGSVSAPIPPPAYVSPPPGPAYGMAPSPLPPAAVDIPLVAPPPRTYLAAANVPMGGVERFQPQGSNLRCNSYTTPV
ncbi:hypothetical protein GGF31_004054 [Allomyces arbusculus]|nr:hypothetical protein GGF31_004054 [Allomyces arbusculus]